MEAVTEYLKRLTPEYSRAYEVDITRLKSKRSIPQNKLYRMWLSCIASETGNSVDDTHEYFKHKFLGGDMKRLFGEEFYAKPSTAKLSKDKFSEFLYRVQAFAADNGIILPSPEDMYFEAFMDEYGRSV